MNKTRQKVKIIKKKLSTGNNQLPLLRITLNSVRRRSSIMFQTNFYIVYDYKQNHTFPFLIRTSSVGHERKFPLFNLPEGHCSLAGLLGNVYNLKKKFVVVKTMSNCSVSLS